MNYIVNLNLLIDKEETALAYTVSFDSETIITEIESILWEENKYTKLYSMNKFNIMKHSYADQINQLKSLIIRIRDNITLIDKYVELIEKTNTGEFQLDTGYTITVATDLAEIVDKETWKVPELRINMTGDFTCKIELVNRIKSRK
jgi:hypothetical protein